MFHSFLHNATKMKRVWIILDGLDELPQASSINNLLWLPRELPDNVRIVLTTLTNGGCYNNLKVRYLTKTCSNYRLVSGLRGWFIRKRVSGERLNDYVG